MKRGLGSCHIVTRVKWCVENLRGVAKLNKNTPPGTSVDEVRATPARALCGQTHCWLLVRRLQWRPVNSAEQPRNSRSCGWMRHFDHSNQAKGGEMSVKRAQSRTNCALCAVHIRSCTAPSRYVSLWPARGEGRDFRLLIPNQTPTNLCTLKSWVVKLDLNYMCCTCFVAFQTTATLTQYFLLQLDKQHIVQVLQDNLSVEGRVVD